MISVADLTVEYQPGRPALFDVSLAFPRGTFTVLLGPSGAGKSTLLRCLNGLVQLSGGIVLGADGLGIAASGPALKAHRKRTAMIFQQHHLVGRSTALANAANGRLAHLSRRHAFLPMPRQEKLLALKALSRVGLEGKAFTRVAQLSGGEQQRVGIARALVQRPQLLLADEPVASLDPATADQVLSLLKDIARQDGLTVIVSLHQVELAQRFGDVIIGLNQGRVVFEGSPAALDAAALERIYAPGRPLDGELAIESEAREGLGTPALAAPASR